jgi:hypothetical protein
MKYAKFVVPVLVVIQIFHQSHQHIVHNLFVEMPGMVGCSAQVMSATASACTTMLHSGPQ